MTNRSLILVAILLIVLATACNKERDPCLTLKTAQANIECLHYRDTSRVATDTLLPAALFAAITDNGVRGIRYTTPSAFFAVTLSPISDSCKWIMATDSVSEVYDTLTFAYSRSTKFLSNACGYTTFFSLKRVATTHNNIDSVLVTDPGITNNVNAKNIKIYIRRGL